ncbi:26S proteasome non-ATPase regulatory subunit 5 isoform X3 [Periplaneta americana]|uniref:26S proteasome non-ATPase regulatory subunit 5 isoform X3 n=1 Tax=Periplaneta americana TaxID=6978 RepID=UPI0037E7478A
MMTNDFQWFESNVSRLSDDAFDRMHLLSELKIAFGALSYSQQKSILCSLKLDQIFDCLNSSRTEQIVLTCDVLILFLSILEPRVVFEQYEEALKRALRHPVPCVKQFVLKELQRAVSDDSLMQRLYHQESLILSMITCVRHEDMSVANSAVTLLVKFGSSQLGLHVLYSDSVVACLKETMAERDVIRFRVYEVVVELSVHTEAGLQKGHISGLLPALIAELSGEDVLLQMNALELLTKLALCEHGLQYLQQQGVLNALANRATTINDDPLASLTLPGLIKFFGNVTQSRPKEVFAEYPNIVTTLFETFDSPDLVLLGVAMETVGYIGTSVEGKYMLDSLDDTMDQTMKKLAHKISNLPTELRVRAMNTVANLLQLKLPDQNSQSLAITKSWFEKMAVNPMELIMSVCRQPFTELRLAGMQVLQVLAEQQWGQECINSTPGLIEFLLDRSIETNKLCKDAKFEVVKTVVESPTAGTTFDTVTLLRFREYVREGPFFVEAQTEVAIEGAS